MNLQEFHLSDISPRCLLKFLAKHAWMIVLAAAVGAMAANLYAATLYTPCYQASMTYAVTARRTSYNSAANISSAKETTAVLSEMLVSDMTLRNVRSASPELENFSGEINTSQVGESNFIVITVTDNSPEQAFRALQALTQVLPTITAYISSDTVVLLVRNPQVSTTPVNPLDAGDWMRLAGILGGGAMTVLLFLFFLQQDTVQTRSAARRKLNANIIASIHREGRRSWRQLRRQNRGPLQVFAPTTSFDYTEQINVICTQMELAATSGCKSFLITGASENEGKSTVAGNVAAALSIRGKRVALLDCDLRNPSLNKFFDDKYAADIPLNKLLNLPLTRDNLLLCMQQHERLGLYMLFPGTPDRRCTELLSSSRMDELLLQLRNFDFIILDSPPMGYFADAEALADKVDASMLVVRQDCSPAFQIGRCVDILQASRSRFLGCILNDMTRSLTDGYGYGYGYGYGKGYGYGQSRKKGG